MFVESFMSRPPASFPIFGTRSVAHSDSISRAKSESRLASSTFFATSFFRSGEDDRLEIFQVDQRLDVSNIDVQRLQTTHGRRLRLSGYR
jgi:5-formaminoimidazole-4-carboxamide-1-beta-D-ribofuranosyl 5'-monophosphate synthetase